LTHVVATYDHLDGIRKGKIYINGSLTANSVTDEAGSADALPDDSAINLTIGNTEGLDRTFDGLIDDVRIYSVAKTAAQIKSDYETTRGRYGV
jgi:hypothetical protein